MMNYRTKGAKNNSSVTQASPVALSDDIVNCKATNLNTKKCDNCENKFVCLLADIPDSPSNLKVKRPVKRGVVINTIDIEFNDFDYSGVLADGLYDYVANFISKLRITVDIEKGGKVVLTKVNGKDIM